MLRSITFALLMAAAFALGALASVPDCPEEDSCTADYYAGAWHIELVQP